MIPARPVTRGQVNSRREWSEWRWELMKVMGLEWVRFGGGKTISVRRRERRCKRRTTWRVFESDG